MLCQINAFIQLEGEAIGTRYAANESTREAFAADIKGSEWMIYVDEDTKQEHWDFVRLLYHPIGLFLIAQNVIGRFVGFPTVDLQANADINFNVSKLAAATADFEGDNDLSDTIRRLASNGTEKLTGNKGFWASDYMVHRRDNFILGNKMISERSVNTEYTNSANPFGYHMGQGTLFSYVTGTEYKDIQAAWDWNLIPGTTVLLDHPTLSSEVVDVNGKRDFVGVVSDEWVGTSVEDYIDPNDASLSYRKAWFFVDECVVVITTGISVNTSSNVTDGTPVITVLDNRAAVSSDILVDGEKVDATRGVSVNGSTLYYGGNGYISLGDPFHLTLAENNRTGNWSAISTSTVGEVAVPVFSAYTAATGSSQAYAFWPAVDIDTFNYEAANPSTVPIYGDEITGLAGAERLSLVFWPQGGTQISVDLSAIGWSSAGSVTVTSSEAGAYLFATRWNSDDTRTLVITMSDPTQILNSTSFELAFEGLSADCSQIDWDDGCQKTQAGVSFEIELPIGGFAGSSVFREITLV